MSYKKTSEKTRKKSFQKQLASDAYREAKVASTKLFFTVHCWKKYEILFYSAYWLKWFAVLKNKVICIAERKNAKKYEIIVYSAFWQTCHQKKKRKETLLFC